MAKLVVAVLRHKAPWALPVLGLALFVHRNFIKCNGPGNAVTKAEARYCNLPKLKRQAHTKHTTADEPPLEQTHLSDGDNVQQQPDTQFLQPDGLMEWYHEDEVEALQQARTSQAHLHSMLQQ